MFRLDKAVPVWLCVSPSLGECVFVIRLHHFKKARMKKTFVIIICTCRGTHPHIHTHTRKDRLEPNPLSVRVKITSSVVVLKEGHD